jgi:hypothetical protein
MRKDCVHDEDAPSRLPMPGVRPVATADRLLATKGSSRPECMDADEEAAGYAYK